MNPKHVWRVVCHRGLADRELVGIQKAICAGSPGARLPPC